MPDKTPLQAGLYDFEREAVFGLHEYDITLLEGEEEGDDGDIIDTTILAKPGFIQTILEVLQDLKPQVIKPKWSGWQEVIHVPSADAWEVLERLREKLGAIELHVHSEYHHLPMEEE